MSGVLVAFEDLVFVGAFDGFAPAVIWWLVRAGGMSGGVVAVLGKMGPSAGGSSLGSNRPRWSVVGWLWRIAVALSAYFVLFMVAGLLIMRLEAVPDYTASEDGPASGRTQAIEQEVDTHLETADSKVRVPPVSAVFTFIVVRGLACLAFALPLIHTLTGGRWTTGLVVGMALAVLSVVVPLLPPNPDMTTAARFAQMLEIGWSNFAYGLLIGFLFGRCP